MIEKTDKRFETYLSQKLFRAGLQYQLIFEQRYLRPKGLTAQEWRVIFNLYRYGQCHVRQLTRLSEMDAGHVSRTARKLESKGLVTRQDDARDARRVKLSLTAKGDQLFNQIAPNAFGQSAEVAKLLGPKRYAALIATLEEILDWEDDLLP